MPIFWCLTFSFFINYLEPSILLRYSFWGQLSWFFHSCNSLSSTFCILACYQRIHYFLLLCSHYCNKRSHLHPLQMHFPHSLCSNSPLYQTQTHFAPIYSQMKFHSSLLSHPYWNYRHLFYSLDYSISYSAQRIIYLSRYFWLASLYWIYSWWLSNLTCNLLAFLCWLISHFSDSQLKPEINYNLALSPF